ncbi:MAG: glycosyltransferase family 39 protein [Terriglobales bacterium]
MPPSSRRRPPYLTMFLVALLIRVTVTHFLYKEWLDPFVLAHWAFGRVGRSLATGQGFGNPIADTGPSALLPPIYPYILAGIFKLFGVYTKSSIIAALVLNGIISSATCIPIYFLAKKNFGERAAKWAGWGWALSPYGIYYGADWAWSTPLITLLLCCLFLWALNLEDDKPRAGAPHDRVLCGWTVARWFAFGLVSGAAILTEPSILSVVPLLILYTCYRRQKQHRLWLIPAITTALAVAITIAPWTLRNYELFHKLIPVRSGLGLELYIGNNGYDLSWVNRDLHPNHNAAEQSEYERDGEIAYMNHKQEQATDYIKAYPAWYAKMTVRRFIYLWTGYWSLSRAYLKEEPLDPPNIFVCTTLTILMLIGLIKTARENPSLAARYGIAFLFYPAVYCLTHPETYYIRPLDPLINILAAYAVFGFLSRKKAPAPDLALML